MMSTSRLSRSVFWLPLRFAPPFLGRMLASGDMVPVGLFVMWRYTQKSNVFWCTSHGAGLSLSSGSLHARVNRIARRR